MPTEDIKMANDFLSPFDIAQKIHPQVQKLIRRIVPPQIVPVARRDDIAGPLSHSMINVLHLLDLRLRALNKPLFANILGKNDTEKKMKSLFFQALYIPTARMNPAYRISTLTGFELYVLQTTSTQYLDFTGNKKIISAAPHLANTTEALPTIIFAGPPIRLSDTYSLVFLSLESSATNRILIDGKTIDVTKGQTLSSTNTRHLLTRQITDILTGKVDPDPYLTQFNQMCNDVAELIESRLIPVIIKGPLTSSLVLANSTPGVSFSLIDIANYSRILFQGSKVAMNSATGSGHNTLAHSTGDAVDISLAPFYAVTGYILREDPANLPHVFDRNYRASGLHQQLQTKNINVWIPKSTQNERDVVTAIPTNTQYAQSKVSMPLIHIPLNIQPIPGDTSATNVQLLFTQLFAEIGYPAFYSDIMSDLPSKDQVWHHIESQMPTQLSTQFVGSTQ